MPLWKRLYSTFWLAFFSCLLIPRWMGSLAGLPVHALFGLAALVLALGNPRRLAAPSVPARLQRISRVTMGFAIFQIANGLALGAVSHLTPDLPYAAPVLIAIHVVCALTILTQAASLATAYDMWEEKEWQAAASQADKR